MSHTGQAIQTLLLSGVTSADVAQLTGRPQAEVEVALAKIEPVRGKQARTRTYDLWAALGALAATPPQNDEEEARKLEEAIRRMKPSQLPPALALDFWRAMSSRQKYHEESGQLWRTDKVKLLVSQIYKAMRQAMSLMEDNVDQQTALTLQQRAIIRGISDGVLIEARELIKDHFSGWDSLDDHDQDGVR